MAISIKFNDKCLVRHQDCKRIFGGSHTCFVACPSSDEIALELEIIRQKLREVEVEPYIAVDQREFQKDIFCKKICTKIIESLFCVVILNDVVDAKDKVRKPNANVYYEYGLMTAFRKKIVPVQFVEHNLAFNIQSLDTLKYNTKNFSRLIEEAIRMTLLDLETERNEKHERTSQGNTEWALDLMGLVRTDDRYRFRHERVLSSRSLGFEIFHRPRDGRLFFSGIFEPQDHVQDIILRAKMLTLRIKNYCDQMSSEIAELRASQDERSRSIINERISDQEKLRRRFAESTILVIKRDLEKSDDFLKAYEDSASEIGFKLQMEILDDTKIKQLLES